MTKTDKLRKEAKAALGRWFLKTARKRLAEICRALRETYGKKLMPHKVCCDLAVCILNDMLEKETRGLRGVK